ncbi:MAG TPA: DotA/TraY family protein, partial [Ktedonobacterales bacterium]|nr:DotA/TraY family protein [Ktedonobacterales bacterium]
NSALSDAVHAFSVQVLEPQEGTFDRSSKVVDALQAVRQGLNRQADQSAATSTPKPNDGGFAPIKKWIATKLGWETPTGNWSMGQAILMNSTVGLGVGVDDGSVNPVIMFKNMGDYLMTISEACYGAVTAFKVSGAGKAIEAIGDSALVKAAPGGGVVSGVASAISGLISMLWVLAGAFMLIGIVMSIYIPLVPYLTWMGGLVQYFVVVMEGLVAAGIGALSHMEAEGDGMGQRTERFYIFLLNAVARPALMLLVRIPRDPGHRSALMADSIPP